MCVCVLGDSSSFSHHLIYTSSRMQRTAVVVGVANKRSLAWSCARSLLQGNFDHVIVTYQCGRFQPSIERMVQSQNDMYAKEFVSNGIQGTIVPRNNGSQRPKLISSFPCDVSHQQDVQSLFEEKIPSLLLDQSRQDSTGDDVTPGINALVHSVAYAPMDAMKPERGSDSESFPLLHTTSEAFDIAHSVSSYSLLELSRYALPLLTTAEGGVNASQSMMSSSSITALSYLGSIRATPNYNIMGPAKASLEAMVRGLALELSPPPHSIRVNAVSAGPVNTLAARGIKDFTALKSEAEGRSMMRRGVTSEEVGNVVAFLAGEGASGVTGQVWFCDGGYCAHG